MKQGGPELVFASYLADGRLMLQRNSVTGKYIFYPRVITPEDDCEDLEWHEVSGYGTVYSTTVVRQRPEKGGDYNVSLIDLSEGPRMMSHVVGVRPTDVFIGMDVQADITTINGVHAVVFRPAI